MVVMVVMVVMVMGGGRERDGSGSSRLVSRERWSGWTRGTGYQGQESNPCLYFNTKCSLQPSKTDGISRI